MNFAAAMSPLLVLALSAQAQEGKPTPYPTMAPIEQYRAANVQDEIALARTAAPPSISANAQVLVFGQHGYEIAVKGSNDFVCFVERSWTAGFDDPQFWNPKLRAPNCFNAAAAHSVLPQYLKRAEWVSAGLDKAKLIEKTQLAFAHNEFIAPEPGAFSFMLSKQGYVSDDAQGPWLPHLMFFVPHGQAVNWGAGLEDSPVLGGEAGSAIEPSVLFVPVRLWSDGSPAPPPVVVHHH